MLFNSKRSHYHHLKKKWTAQHRQLQSNLWDKHKESLDWLTKIPGRQLATGSLGGLLLLTTPTVNMLPSAPLLLSGQEVTKDTDSNVLLASHLADKLPAEVRALSPEEERIIGESLSNDFGFKVTAE